MFVKSNFNIFYSIFYSKGLDKSNSVCYNVYVKQINVCSKESKMKNQAKLKAILTERRLRIQDFAASVGIKQSTFYKKLSGETPFTVSEAITICEALGIDNVRDVFMK